MNEVADVTEEKFSFKHSLAFSSAQFSDVVAYQSFTFWIFTFYYTVVQINVVLISIAFIIWSFWNAFNDPLLGYISDHTHTKWGRRIPWIMVALIPLSIIMIFLFTPPITLGLSGEILNFIFFVIIIIVFEGFYTMFSLNQVSLLPEQFIDSKLRGKVNNVRQLFSILGLIIASILPSFFIPDPTMSEYLPNWSFFGITLCLSTFIGGFIFLKWGAKEKKEFQFDYKETPGFVESIKLCVKSKSFRWYIPAEIANWFVYGLLPTIVPLYGKFVLGIDDTFLISLLLGVTFISAAIFINIWRKVAEKIGPRKAWMCSLTTWVITLFPTLFISTLELGMICFFIIGIGLSGSMVLIDLIVCDIIDEDEVNTGIRRDASYYGVNSLFMRFSTIFVFLAINLVFNSVGWAVFVPEKDPSELIFGLRILMFVFPAIAIAIGVISLAKYPLDGEKLLKVKEELQKIHKQKKERV